MLGALLNLFATSTTASIACPSETGGTSTTVGASAAGCDTGLPKVSAGSHEVHEALTIFFGIAAIISVLMIVIGAMTLVTSGGKPQNAAKARDTIIYAVVGLIVSLVAEALVAFVLGKL